jgi:lysozyme
MIKIKNWNQFNQPINEEISLSDVSGKIKYLLKRVSNMKRERAKTILIWGLSGLLTITNIDRINNTIKSDNQISQMIDDSDLGELIDEVIEDIKSSGGQEFFNGSKLRLSQAGWDKIKREEGDPKKKGEPVLTAYKLGDGMITVGWGHAEPISRSKYKVGDKITREEAQKLLETDLKVAADGVRRIFTDWSKEGIDRPITQDQFDALVSMALNLGVSGLRKTEVIQYIKKGDYKKAGEKIKNQSLNKNFHGLESRRQRESNLFLSYLESDSELSKNL